MANRSEILTHVPKDLGTLFSLSANTPYLLQNKSNFAIYIGDFADVASANESDAFEVAPYHFLGIPKLPSSGSLFGWCTAMALVAIGEAG